MNKAFLIFLQVLLVSCLTHTTEATAQSQSHSPYETHEILKDSTFESNTFSAFTLYIIGHPNNGSASRAGNSMNRFFTYTPDSSFTGRDSVSVEVHYTVGGNPIIKWFHYAFDVKESIVWINDDEFMVPANSDWTYLDLMANDSSTLGDLSISNVSAVNNGQVDIVNDSLFFKPTEEFSGMAYVRYTACDSIGECGSATAHINVVDTSDIVAHSTIHLHTMRNRSIRVSLPSDGFELTQVPDLGLVQKQGETGIWEYTPIQNVTGQDSFEFELDSSYLTTVYITIHDLHDPNSFLVDDYIYTPLNESVDFNVLENDLKGNLRINSFTQPDNGSLTHNGNGNFTYAPDQDFSGRDHYTYTVCILGNCETAQVKIFVGNLSPQNDATYQLTTTKNRPLVINYDVPISNFMFHTTQEPDYGDLTVYPGYDTITIGCNTVSGNNLVVYDPDEDFVGQDEFELEYCVDGQPDCQIVKVEIEVIDLVIDSICVCIDDCVWPGDVNYDGKVDMRDLLTLGWYMGETGAVRYDVDLQNWYGQSGDDWDDEQYTGENLKHADTDGDGVVTAADTAAISNFYHNVHTLVTESNFEYKPYSVSLVESSTGPYQAGDMVTFDVVVGSNSNPVIDLHGISMTYFFNNAPFGISEFNAHEYNQSWLTYDGPSLFMAKSFDSQLDFALTRTDGFGAAGFGIVTEVSIVIEDDIDGIRLDNSEDQYFSLQFDLKNITGFFADESEFLFPETTAFIDVVRPGAEPTIEFGEDLLHLFPNPSGPGQGVNLHMNGGFEIEEIQVYDVMGKLIMQRDDIASNRYHFDLAEKATGLYIVRIKTDGGVVSRKFQWVAE